MICSSVLQLRICRPVEKGLVALVVHTAEVALQRQIVIPRVAVGRLLRLERTDSLP